MDLIRNDVIIDKMAVFSVGTSQMGTSQMGTSQMGTSQMGTSYIISKMSFVCGFHVELLNNKGKKLVSVMWRCKIVPPDETRLTEFAINAKPCAYHSCLVIKYVCLTLPLAGCSM